VAGGNLNNLDRDSLKIQQHCPICLSRLTIVLKSAIRTINKKSNEVVELRECNNCKHWWHSPMPTQQYLSSLYEGNSKFVNSAHPLEPPEDLMKKFNSGCTTSDIDYNGISLGLYTELISMKEFNYLEIGCGNGELFRRFCVNAKVCYAVDPLKQLNLPNIVMDIMDLPKGLKFDVIVINDVLEHLESPLGMLKFCKNIANKGARIYCSFPNKDSWLARIKKEKWDMVMPVGHLHYFSRESVSVLFKTSKWRIIEQYAHPGAGIFWRSILRARWKIFLNDFIHLYSQWYVNGVAE